MVTAVSQFIEQLGSMIKGISKHNYHSLTFTIHQTSKSQHRHLSASRPVSVHRQLSSSEPNTMQQMDAYELVFIG